MNVEFLKPQQMPVPHEISTYVKVLVIALAVMGLYYSVQKKG